MKSMEHLWITFVRILDSALQCDLFFVLLARSVGGSTCVLLFFFLLRCYGCFVAWVV